ncbi:hypothetical protein ASPZODRAFT_170280 [Penicilliopsis zonata CBS 506.65]|uniref:SMP-30/Gluconolactonase/LRE-like region domain-containing protein n=1 Tax=Penicilliopsis zonata CBS 506.65 TaxID=1073090 RepID=A0A1L9S528_9EURO|nr:hypothetical protein ASPZODRAFT_170280 [Penicilliopsis zonata CBS 506.65]OJJ42256.1 hypothetical protein ASPZODRAFT_170280 [Penicilliopsis zonata CBS 506.65]
MDPVESFIEPHTALGESPLWRASDQTLHYLDVLNNTIHILDLSSTSYARRKIQCPEPVASMNFCRQGGYILCTFTGVVKLGEDGTWTELVKVIPSEQQASVRLNDSAVDPLGRLWFGSIDKCLDESDLARPVVPTGYKPAGCLYRYDPDDTLHVQEDGGIVCSNGIGWTADQTTMFHTDSYRQLVWAYDFDQTTGEVANRRVHVDRSGQQGEPDGLIVDSEGNVFTFIWDASLVEKYDRGGRLLQTWTLNAPSVTHGAWVGQEMQDIIVTTAMKNTGECSDEGGGLFRLENVTLGRGVEKTYWGEL